MCYITSNELILKYFDNSEKNMSFLSKDDNALVKYNGISDKVREVIGKKLHSEPIYVDEQIKTKVKFIDGAIYTKFNHSRIPKEYTHCVCVSAVTIGSVMKIDRRYYLHVYLEICVAKLELDSSNDYDGSDFA